MKPDLTLLYSELGLKPNCSLAELQLAYRRRISELQPRRLTENPPSEESSAILRDLVSLYTTASRFHRRYGRLPGAPPHRSLAAGLSIASVRRPPGSQASRTPNEPASSTPGIALGLAVLLLVLLFGLLALTSGEWLR